MSLELIGANLEETRLIKQGIQRPLGLTENGLPDALTIALLANKLNPKAFPATLLINGRPTLVSRNILLFSPGGTASVANYTNCMSGGFTYPRCKTPGAILRNNNVDVCSVSSHAWLGYPDSCIYQYNDGTIRISRVKSTSELPNLPLIKRAISGAGLMNMYNPKAEGFYKFIDSSGIERNYSDVFKMTNHLVLGAKNNLFFGVFFKDADVAMINSECTNIFKFDFAILLDGGTDISAMNGSLPESKINLYKKQGYMLQFV